MLPVGCKTRKRDIVAVLVVAAEVKVVAKVKVSLVDGVCVEGLAAAQAKDSGEHLSRRDVKGLMFSSPFYLLACLRQGNFCFFCTLNVCLVVIYTSTLKQAYICYRC